MQEAAMFFVFGPSGQMYRGGPENLAHISPVRRVTRPQALRTRGTETPPFVLETPPPSPAPGGVNLRGHDAVTAYVKTEQGPAQPRQPLSHVRDVMTSNALTVRPDVVVNDAWHTLAAYGVAQAPVVDAQGRVVGLLLRADMAPLDLLPEPGHIQQTIALAKQQVAEMMVSPVPTVSPETDLRRVATVLLDTGLPGLPVTDEYGMLAGFISRTDILRAVAADPPLDLWS
jgi:CBS domain-containing protein